MLSVCLYTVPHLKNLSVCKAKALLLSALWYDDADNDDILPPYHFRNSLNKHWVYWKTQTSYTIYHFVLDHSLASYHILNTYERNIKNGQLLLYTLYCQVKLKVKIYGYFYTSEVKSLVVWSLYIALSILYGHDNNITSGCIIKH